jgi:hypothetical protein
MLALVHMCFTFREHVSTAWLRVLGGWIVDLRRLAVFALPMYQQPLGFGARHLNNV